MELIFFTAARMVLCFIFAIKTVLITQQCFTCCWAVLARGQGLLFLTLPPPQSRLGLGKRLGGHTARTADLNRLQKYSIPYNVMLSNKTGSGEGGRRVKLSKVAIARRLAGHWPAGGRWWVIAFASLGFLFLFFPFTYWTVFISMHEFSCFRLSNAFSHLLGEVSKQRSRGLPASQGQPTTTCNWVFHFTLSLLGRAFLMQKVLGLPWQAKATCKTQSCFWQLGVWTQATGRLKMQF